MPGRRAPSEDRREQILGAAFKVASRSRLEGLTIRAVAAEAGLSSGLVLFHLGSRDELLIALLDWLLRETIVGAPTAEILALPTARARLLGLIAQELTLLPGRRPRLELFFDYWVAGIGHAPIRGRMQRALQRYRDTMLPLADAVIAEDPARLPGVTGADLAALVIALIEGCVMQAVVDPRGFDVARSLTTLAAVIGDAPAPAPAPAARAVTAAGSARRPRAASSASPRRPRARSR